jgi:type I restriction enzyme, R subunit
MIGVLEAKDERHSPDAGLEQAKSYARLLDVPFAYSARGLENPLAIFQTVPR